DFFWMRRISEIEYRNTTLIPSLCHDVAPGNGNERAVVGDAVFLLGLSNRKLVVARRIQVVAAAIEDRVGAPGHLVRRPTAWSHTAAPFIGEEHFGALVIDGGRVPVSEVRIQIGRASC